MKVCFIKRRAHVLVQSHTSKFFCTGIQTGQGIIQICQALSVPIGHSVSLAYVLVHPRDSCSRSIPFLTISSTGSPIILLLAPFAVAHDPEVVCPNLRPTDPHHVHTTFSSTFQKMYFDNFIHRVGASTLFRLTHVESI